MNNYFSYENFGPIGGGGGASRPFGGMGSGGASRPLGGMGSGPMGGGPRPFGGMGGGGGPRPFGRMGHGRPFGMNYPHRYYHHPKPRYHYNYDPYYYYNSYYYPYNYYYYPVVAYNDQDFCFCTDPKDDEQSQEEKVCVGDTCGVCIPRSFCTTCDEKITCKKKD